MGNSFHGRSVLQSCVQGLQVPAFANMTTMTTILEDPRISPPNPLMDDLLPLITTSIDAAKVSSILNTVNDCLRPWTALWNQWDAFFTAVVHLLT